MWKLLLEQTFTLMFRAGEFPVLLLNGSFTSLKVRCETELKLSHPLGRSSSLFFTFRSARRPTSLLFHRALLRLFVWSGYSCNVPV